MFNISFDVLYKLKMGSIVIQKHEKGFSKWRILNEKFESCFCDENVTEDIWVKADALILDPHASYSFESKAKNKK